jgi:predicted ArsR family transcriptional regulator
MSFLPWNRHFFTSTRGRIVLLLRRSRYTVDELAQELSLTDNAVRVHLATLERDSLICQSGVRRGSGKPALVYALTPEAEQLFPKAYAPVLQALLDVLTSSMSSEKREEVMQNAGRFLARQWKIAPGELRTRLQEAVAILNQLGGLAELEDCGESYRIQGYSCPLAAVVPNHPEMCHLSQTLLAELLGVPVVEQCEQGTPARCCFSIARI